MLLTSQRVEESQAVLRVPWQSWTHQAANVSGAWADSGVSQQERSWLEDKAFIFLLNCLPRNLLAINVPVATWTWY